jgi:hypothetical protein
MGIADSRGDKLKQTKNQSSLLIFSEADIRPKPKNYSWETYFL